jgi:hypothetical protein
MHAFPTIEKPRQRCKDIKMDLGGTGWGGMAWINLAQDRDQWWSLVNTVMNLQLPYHVRKFISS